MAKPGEKIERFKRVAVPRVQKVIDALEAVGRCGNRASYDYTEAEATRIWEAIFEAYEDAEAKFKERVPEEKVKFSLAAPEA